MGTTGPGTSTRQRRTLGLVVSGHHGPRHGPCLKRLLEHLGIESLFCVIGGSMGAMQVLQWAASYPKVFAAVPIAGRAPLCAEHRVRVGRQAIMADPTGAAGNI